MNENDVGQDTEDKEELDVPVAWEALEDAFENNAPEVHSYLHFDTGEVIRIVDGVADPSMHTRIIGDSRYLRIDPVSSREQYRWMERFIATVEDEELRRALNVAIDGKGAFRRFKDALVSHAVDRERWFAFRSERLRSCMESWLTAHGIHSVERPTWHVPTAEQVQEDEPQAEKPAQATDPRASEVAPSDGNRTRLHELVDALSSRDMEMARTFLEYLRDRVPASMRRGQAGSEPPVAEALQAAKPE
ncbi:MAG: hypothetical protein DRH30_03835 [Deltaproteobacteria bacterium]|nr:MAG: hypothetical protein DRH30_03835 [Deltaproteobacteria bacterium]